jgi:hypothetical protein
MGSDPITPDVNRSVRFLHGLSALLIGSFIALHFTNHAAMFWGTSAHISMMTQLRSIYRFPLIEGVLLAALCFQIGSGTLMLWRSRSTRSGFIDWAQALSGLGLLLFIANHLVAVLLGRWMLGLDTNYYFAAAGFHVDGWRLFFIPYYFFGVATLGVHLACAFWWRSTGLMCIFGPLMIVLIFSLFAAALVAHMAKPATIPEQYLANYR